MLAMAANGRVGVIESWYPGTSRPSTYRLWDTKAGRVEPLDALAGLQQQSFAIDPTGATAIWGASDGTIHVHRLADGAERLLVGHFGSVPTVVVSPDGKWIASAGEDSTIRLWPMPDFSRPAIETMPHPQLIAKLKTLTNIRVVRAADTADGWKLELDRFPGWRTAPSW
jgi:WD40 repeat protein